MESNLISVIINCYNGELYLREAIDSVINQTYSNWELIFWDNCSTDNSAEILLSYKDPRIKYYLSDKNVPLGQARNQAIEKATGGYIGFLDADDIWAPNKLEVQMQKMLSDTDVGLVHSNYLNFWEGGNVVANTKQLDGEESFQYLLTQYKIGMSAALVSKSVMKTFDIKFDKTLLLIEDFDFFLLIAYHAKVLYCKEVLMEYRMHPNSLTNTSKKWSKEFYYLVNKLKSFLTTDELNRYAKEIKWIEIRAINADIIEKLDSNHRIEALKSILQNLHKSPKLLFPIVGVIFGYKNYNNIIGFVRKRNYKLQ